MRFLPSCVFAGAVLVAGTACHPGADGPQTFVFDGATMGTTFTVKVVADHLSEADQVRLQRSIDDELGDVNEKMSHYLEDSELSRFNQWNETTPFAVSPSTLEVFREAREISELTGGAFDITAGPLVNVWGFGPEERPEGPPSEAEIEQALERSGIEKLEIDVEEATLRKSRPDLYCDLSAIAKGYGVDRVAEMLERGGIENYMVEVGGEVRTSGTNASGKSWRIAIEQPLPGRRSIQTVVPLSGLAMATSGGYRNFYEADGVRFSHTIDPRTGRPITHRLASVSVVDQLSARADALATGLLVLGPEEGYRLAVDEEIPALFIVGGETDEFREQATPAFEKLRDGLK